MAETTATKDGMQKTLDAVTSKIDEFIAKLPPVAQEQLTQLETFNPALKKAYVVGGVGMLFVLAIVYLMGGMRLAVGLVSFLYPAYMSLQCIENKPGAGEEKQWLTYWVIYSLFGIVESALSFITTMIPYYSFFKVAMFMYLFHPHTTGATKVYDKVVSVYVTPLIMTPKAKST